MKYEVDVIAKLWAIKRYTVAADHPDEAEEVASVVAKDDIKNGTMDGWDMYRPWRGRVSHVVRARMVTPTDG